MISYTSIAYHHLNKAIRDGRPRPPRHQVGWDIPLHFDTNPESLRPFVPEIWPNNVFNLSATYDLDLWPKILKIFVSHGVPIRNMYAKFHNDRLRNGWDITLWNFAKTRTNKHTNKHTNKQTHKQTHKQTWGRGNYVLYTWYTSYSHLLTQYVYYSTIIQCQYWFKIH